jgi:GNAT superfamily N-acetyltransferase
MRFTQLDNEPLPLSKADSRQLGTSFTEIPETVIPIYLLHTGLCKVWVMDGPSNPHAIVIKGDPEPDELQAFGEPEAIWELLRAIPDWTCVDVSEDLADGLADEIERGIGSRPRFYGDIYHILSCQPAKESLPDIRWLGVKDLPLLLNAPTDLHGGGWYRTEELMLQEGLVFGAVINKELVAIAHTGAETERYTDIGVVTLKPFRNRGLATALASSIARAVLEKGKTPVWSTGEDNFASLQVAKKLGFKEVGRRTYLILCDPEDHR